MKISAPEGKFLQIQILQNAIVRSPECEKDYLRVLDGPNQMYGPLPGEFHELIYKKSISGTNNTTWLTELIIDGHTVNQKYWTEQKKTDIRLIRNIGRN